MEIKTGQYVEFQNSKKKEVYVLKSTHQGLKYWQNRDRNCVLITGMTGNFVEHLESETPITTHW